MQNHKPDISDGVAYFKTLISIIDSSLKEEKCPDLSLNNWLELKESLENCLVYIQSPGAMNERVQNLEKERDLLRELLEVTNLRLERQVEQLSLLRVIYDVSSQSVLLNDPFRFLIQQIVSVSNAENGSIMLLNKAGNRLILVAASGTKDMAPEEISFEVGEGIAGTVAEKGKPFYADDVFEDQLYKNLNLKEESIRSLLTLPLICHKTVLGVLNLSSSRVGAFDQNMQRFLQLVAGYLALLAIETG